MIGSKIVNTSKGVYGHVDSIDRRGISGWILDLDNGVNAVEVYINGVKVAEKEANLPRPDIDAIVGKTTNCGFFIPWRELRVNNQVLSKASFNIVILHKASKRPISGNFLSNYKFKVLPFDYKCPDEYHDNSLYDRTSNIKGFVDIINEDGIAGWLVDFEDREGAEKFIELYVNGVKLTDIPVNKSRPDINEIIGENGYFGFVLYPHDFINLHLPENILNEQWKDICLVYKNKKLKFNEENCDPDKLRKAVLREVVISGREFLEYKDRVVIFPQNDTIGFTIVSKNYLHFALVLGKSFIEKNPESDFAIFLSDLFEKIDDFKIYEVLLESRIILISLYDLKLSTSFFELEELLFKYDILEMNTAVKPWIIQYIFDIGYHKVVYLDPDILVMGSLDKIFKYLNDYNILLTPHITEEVPDEDDTFPRNVDFLLSGVYNLGFIALKNTEESKRFIKWWQRRLADGCYMDVARGYHVDQRWIDFAPALFEEVLILKDKDLNVAYWNLHERRIKYDQTNNKYMINDVPLTFFHFSGIDINQPIKSESYVSKHSKRYKIADIPDLKYLFEFYVAQVKTYISKLQSISKSYAFNKFPCSNIPIFNGVRKIYDRELKHRLKNPFSTYGQAEILEHCRKEVMPGLNKLMLQVYNERKDLQDVYPNIINNPESLRGYIEWFKSTAHKEYPGIEKYFIESIETNLKKESCFGVNVIGYITSTFGVAYGAQYLLRALSKMPIQLSVVDIKTDIHESTDKIDIISSFFEKQCKFQLNIFQINADMIPHTYNQYPHFFKGKYNISIWAWEIENFFPFKKAYDYVDEVWAYSRFNAKEFAKYTEKPVVYIPYPFFPLKIVEDRLVPHDIVRKKLGIKKDDFLFMFAFDYHSSFERKNPLGVVKAFKLAFPPRIKDVKLIIKSIHSRYYRDKEEMLLREIGEDDRILYINSALSKEEILSLIRVSDCFVSLHRSEGVGLNLIEAMYYSVPVICTNYGGNTDFTEEDNALLVEHKLIPVNCDVQYSFARGKAYWAEPNIDHAIENMRKIYSNREYGKELGKRGRLKILELQKNSINALISRFKSLGGDLS